MGIVCIMGVDNFSRKNSLQIERMNQFGYSFDVFTNDTLGDSKDNISAGNNLYILADGLIGRLLQIIRYLYRNANKLHHVEIYPGGRFTIFYVFLCKIFGIKTAAIERGELGVNYQYYGPIMKLSAKATYRLVDVVWYREPYLKRELENLGVKTLSFVHNAVQLPENESHDYSRRKRIDFLWVNRLIVERKSEWFIDALENDYFRDTKNVLAGVNKGASDERTIKCQEYALKKKTDNLKIYEYTNPEPFYCESRFFVLPSDIVFCNNSLLEAMAHGVVPLVSDVEAAELIVDDGVNGFVFEHSYKGLLKAMKRAHVMSSTEYAVMSQNAKEKVKQSFSSSSYANRLLDLYQAL